MGAWRMMRRRIALTRRTEAAGAIAFTDTDGRIWATFESIGFTHECAWCGAEISCGLWRAKSDEYICRGHAQVAGEA